MKFNNKPTAIYEITKNNNKQSRKEMLKEKYKDKIYPCKKNINEIIEYVKSKYNVRDRDADSPEYVNNVKCVKLNCINNPMLNVQQLKMNDLNIIIYEIQRNKKSNDIYNNTQEVVSVIFETRLGYISCNCPPLQSELCIMKGISKQDIDNDGFELLNYLVTLDNAGF